MAVGRERKRGHSFSSLCLRYSRADSTYTKANQTRKHSCRFIHRSVGEPAEGSLTRIHVSTNPRIRYPLPRIAENESESTVVMSVGLGLSTVHYLGFGLDDCISVEAYFFLAYACNSAAQVGNLPKLTYFTRFLLVDFYMLFFALAHGSHV